MIDFLKNKKKREKKKEKKKGKKKGKKNNNNKLKIMFRTKVQLMIGKFKIENLKLKSKF